MTYFSFPFRWIMLRLNESRNNADERLYGLPAPLDSDILLATWTKDPQMFLLEQCNCFCLDKCLNLFINYSFDI